MRELEADAIVWALPETPPTSIDPLALTVPELVVAYRDVVAERATYRLMACEALTALHGLTEKYDAVCEHVRKQNQRIADLLGVPAPDDPQ